MTIKATLTLAAAALALALAPGGLAQGPTKSKPAAQQPHTPASTQAYGQWNRQWGAKPPAPPAHFAKKSDWYRHVRACQRKYKSYSARTDTYRSNRGQALRCRL